MDDMILRDLSDVIKNSLNKWPLIVDENDQASTFLRYRDTNYVNCLDMSSMESERFRLALVGAIRYGKPFVLDLMQYDSELLQAVRVVCEQIDSGVTGGGGSGLFEMIFSKDLIRNENYMKYVKVSVDGAEYEAFNFSKMRLDNFKVIFITSNPYPSNQLLALTMPIRVVCSTNGGSQRQRINSY